MKESIEKIEAAAKVATKRNGMFYLRPPRGSGEEPKLLGAHATYFFENWDDERMEFYYELMKNGFKEVKYKAPYHWKLSDGKVNIEYVEGDVYVTSLEPITA